MLIKNAVVHTMDGPVIHRGYLRTEGSLIAEVGDMSALPPDRWTEGEIDAQGGHVLPGLIDAHCHLGLKGAAVGREGDDLNETSAPSTPQLRAVDGINPMDEYFEQARRAGVTCVVTGPGSANVIGGQMAIVKTQGVIVDRMVVRAPGAMKMALGENPKGRGGVHQAPVTRMAAAALIRDQLAKAEEYRRKKVQAELTGSGGPGYDAAMEALAPVVEGKVPVHVHAHRADDIATAVRLAREFGLELVVVHGTEGRLIGDFLEKEGIPVITGPSLTDKSKPELRGLSMDNTAALARAGVQVAICTDHPEIPIQYLLLCAALAARAGMDEEEALAAVTINAACIVGVDDRLGSLTPGKDADLLLMSGHPLELKSRVSRVWIDGQEVNR